MKKLKLRINFMCWLFVLAAVLVLGACSGKPHICTYVGEKIEPTCTEKGYAVYKCECGNSYIVNETEELGHDFKLNTEETYKKQEATCTKKAVYFISCDRCGFISEDEFEFGEYGEHDLQCVVDDKYKNREADCEQKAMYFKSCVDCDYVSEETFEFGKLADHELGQVFDSDIYGSYRICTVCEKAKAELPVISINTMSGENITTKDYVDAKISVNNCLDEYVLDEVSAEVKIRGNGSASYPKKPYRIKFSKKQKMLGLNNDLKAKSWVLLAEASDKSFSRNMIALSLAQNLMNEEYYVSDYKLAEIYINGEYNGVYGVAEQQQVNAGRVDINEAEEDYGGVDIGYLLEFDSYARDEDYYFELDYKKELLTYSGQYCNIDKFNPYYTIKNDIYSIAQQEYIAKYMQNLYDVLYETIYNSSANGYVYKTLDLNGNIIIDNTIDNKEEAVGRLIDIDSLVSTYILNEIVMNVDYGWSSFFMSIDMSEGGNKKLTFEAPWDFDWALTCNFNAIEKVYACNINLDFYTAGKWVNPWLMMLCHEDWFWNKIEEKYSDFRSTNAIEMVCENVNECSRLLEINFCDNFMLWNYSLTVTGYNSEEFVKCCSQKEASALIINWLEKRIEFLDEWWGFVKR